MDGVVRQAIRAAGEVLLTAGLIGLLFIGYLVWGDRAPGREPGVRARHQWPGQLGNFAIAGHRVTAGNPFWSLPSLKDGDLVYIETRLNDYTYRVIGKKWVAPTEVAVLDPVPSHPRQRPTRRLISLITCDPAWTGTHRVIVTGVLVAARPR
jgi:sortase A